VYLDLTRQTDVQFVILPPTKVMAAVKQTGEDGISATKGTILLGCDSMWTRYLRSFAGTVLGTVAGRMRLYVNYLGEIAGSHSKG